jgi:hypothetical protein
MGGLWWRIAAPSAEAIRTAFPQLTVFETEPDWWQSRPVTVVRTYRLGDPPDETLTKVLTASRTAGSTGDDATITLYPPIGPKELELIRANDCRAFPPRLPEQPIFYPVLNREYAEQIARDWNSKDARTGNRGFVTRFALPSAFLARYEPRQVGDVGHAELWVPAEELASFNEQIVGLIEVVAEFRHGVLVKG